ncbi:MAG: hypothetical protein ABIN73_07510 [candidate division WOR-3 bacterium]
MNKSEENLLTNIERKLSEKLKKILEKQKEGFETIYIRNGMREEEYRYGLEI